MYTETEGLNFTWDYAGLKGRRRGVEALITMEQGAILVGMEIF